MSFFYLRQSIIYILIMCALVCFTQEKAQAQVFNIDEHDGQIVNVCEGFFYDSGGERNGYDSSENYAVTFCPEAGSVGKLIRLFFLEVDIRGLTSADQICFYDGNSLNSPEIGCLFESLDAGENYEVSASDDNSSGCITVRFQSGIVGGIFLNKEGWKANILCIEKCPKIESRMLASDPPIDANGFINVCPNQEIQFFGSGEFPSDFDRADAAEFSWYFGDGEKADVIEARHSYKESGGYKVQLTIVDPMTGCSNVNDIDVRVRVSPKPNFELASELTQPICAKDTISLSAAVEDGIASDKSILVRPDTSAFLPSIVRSDSLALPDGEGSAYSSSIFFDNFEANSTFQDSSDLLSVCVNMEHSWARDLKIALRCPSGKEVVLHNFWGQTGGRIRIGVPNENDNFQPVPGSGGDYCWTPLSTNGTWIEHSDDNSNGQPFSLPSGDYVPYQNFNEFIGCPLNGQWTIEVEDLWAQDNGYIFNWQLNFEPQLYAETDPFSPAIVDFEWLDQGNLVYHSRDSVAAVPVDAGGNVFNFKITDEYGCVFDTLATVPVLPITDPNCFNCLDNESPFTLLADTTICNGDEVQLGEGVMALYDTIRFVNMQVYTDLNNSNHPPNNPYESIIEVDNMSPATIANARDEVVKICLNLKTDETEFLSDYDIAIETPSGERLQLVLFQLFTDVGNELQQTCFIPRTRTSLEDGVPPFTGDFSPEGDWDDLIGASKNGEWKLVLSDRVPGPLSTILKDWSITFVSENAVSYSWNTAVGLSCTDCPAPVVTPSMSEEYILRTRDNFNCSYQDTVAVTNIGDFEIPELNCIVIEEQGVLRIDWIPQTGVEDYEISINGSAFEVPNFNFFSHGVTGLDINEQIMIEVRASISNVPENLDCEIPTAQASCVYNACAFKAGFTEPPTAVSCPGDSDGMISVEVNDGIAPFAFLIDGVELQNSIDSNGVFGDLTIGEHELVVMDSDACLDTLIFMIEEPLPLDIAPIIENVSCNNGSDGTINLQVTGGTGEYSYDWSNSSADTLLTDISAAEYAVTITDENGCGATTEVEITEPTAIILDLGITNASCFNTTDGIATTLVSGGTGAYTYLWSSGGDMNTEMELSPGTYTLDIRDENDCVLSEEFEITAPPAIMVDSIYQIPVTCTGTSTGTAIVNISGGTEPYVYQWSDELGQTSSAAQLLAIGNYTVTISDANNCSTTASVTVTEPEELGLSFELTNVSCFAGEDGQVSVLPIGGTGPYTYLWDDSNAQNTETATELVAGTYHVIVTDANNCETESEVIIAEPETAVSATITQTLQSCYGEGASEATVVPAGGMGEYTYLWSDAQTKSVATNLDTLSYTVTVTDANGCELVTDLTIQDLEPFNININASIPSCHGNSDGALAATILTGGTGEGQDYIWDTNPSQSGFFIDNLEGGRTYTVTVTDNQGCIGVKEYPLPQPNLITLTATATDVLCNGDTNGTVSLIDISGGNPIGGYDILWDENAGNSVEQSVSDLAIGTYSVTATDMLGCFGVTEVSVSTPTTLITSFDITDNECNNGTNGAISVRISGGVATYNLMWSTGDTETTISNLTAGEYMLSLTDANACEITQTITVSQPDFIDARPMIEQEISCAEGNDGIVALNPIGGTPPYEYSLNEVDYSASTRFVGLGAGDYDLYIRDANGCIQNTSLGLNDPQPFMAFISPREDIVNIQTGDSIQLFVNSVNATGLVDWEWRASFGKDSISCYTCSDPVVYPTATVYYELYGIDENGCEATDQIQIRVLKDERLLLVPTGFSPNDDGENDILLLHSKEDAIVRSFRMYDRWGEMLYELTDFPVNDPSYGWDGKFRDQEMPTGSYIWVADVEYMDGATAIFRGSTTLIR